MRSFCNLNSGILLVHNGDLFSKGPSPTLTYSGEKTTLSCLNKSFNKIYLIMLLHMFIPVTTCVHTQPVDLEIQ